jgi:uncharacterized protein
VGLNFAGLYLDSNALIYALEGTDEGLRNAFRTLFRSFDCYQFHTSELTLAEMLVDPSRRGDDGLVERYRGLFGLEGNGFIQVHPISTAILTQAAGFRGRQMRFLDRKPGLLDCIHAATAHLSGCSHFMTSDERIRLWDQIELVPATESGIAGYMASLA